MPNIKIFQADVELALKTWTFPDGACGVRLDTDNFTHRTMRTPYQTIVARIQSAADIMTLIMVTDALRRFNPVPIRLVLPCCPYGRQDRACVDGESFSLKAFASVINGMAFEQVTVLDPHSHVTEAVFDRLKVIDQKAIVRRWDELDNRLRQPNVVLISPDAGANKKVANLAHYLEHSSFLRADKLRDLATGRIKETIVYTDRLDGQEIAIVDDLIDGGKTFVELAKILKGKGADRVILYITHGIFSAGVDGLFSDGIDEIWCTSSFRTDIDPRVKMFDISPLFLP